MPYAQQTCAMIEQGMEADDRQRLFGDRRLDPEVQESLPLELISVNEGCALRILSDAATDVETWFHLWEATVALNAMCVRAGKLGTAIRLGLRGNLFMEISAQPALSSLVGAVNGTAATDRI